MALAIPTYTMNCFLLPRSLIVELEGFMAKFWWAKRKMERKIHWINWSQLCKPKLEGRFEFKNLKVFNLAHIAKKEWSIMQNQSFIFYKLYEVKYFHLNHFHKAQLGRSPSYAWRNIMEAKPWLIKWCKWHIRNGKSLETWWDWWILDYRLVIHAAWNNAQVREVTKVATFTVYKSMGWMYPNSGLFFLLT